MTEKIYFSGDVETAGATPGHYSMLSFGVCVLGHQRDPEYQFYEELRPINRNYVIGAMRVGCKGLRCLDELQKGEYDPRLDTRSDRFEPGLVLDVLDGYGTHPLTALEMCADWVREKAGGKRPVYAAAPIVFDGMFMNWYFQEYGIENPFGFSGEDINSMLRGATGDINDSIKRLRKQDLPHNALLDAIIQADEFEEVLRLTPTQEKI